MKSSLVSVNTFVIRFWLERSGSGARWRGSIKHIPNGEDGEFLRIEDLVRFFMKFQINLDDSHKSNQEIT